MSQSSTQSTPTGSQSTRLSRVAHLGVLSLAIVFYLLILMVAVGATHHGIAPGGAPLFYDFDAFYEAGRFVLRGDASGAYDDVRMVAAEHGAFPGMTVRLPWNYPPGLQLLVAPLSALPYVPAWLVWSALGCAAYLAGVRSLTPTTVEPLWLLAPAVAVNLFFGQNALLFVGCLMTGVGLLERRPLLAGCVLGLLACKPQFAPAPLALLLVGRHWRSLGTAVASQAVLFCATLILMGTGPWSGFLERILHPTSVFTSSSSDWRAIPSVMTLCRTLGLPSAVGSATHWIVAGAVALMAAWTWHRTTEVRARTAAAGLGCLLITPYLRGYDFAFLVPASILLTEMPTAHRASPRMIAAHVAATLCWAAPALLMFTTPAIQYGPLFPLSAAVLMAWRLLDPVETADATPLRRESCADSPDG